MFSVYLYIGPESDVLGEIDSLPEVKEDQVQKDQREWRRWNGVDVRILQSSLGSLELSRENSESQMAVEINETRRSRNGRNTETNECIIIFINTHRTL